MSFFLFPIEEAVSLLPVSPLLRLYHRFLSDRTLPRLLMVLLYTKKLLHYLLVKMQIPLRLVEISPRMPNRTRISQILTIILVRGLLLVLYQNLIPAWASITRPTLSMMVRYGNRDLNVHYPFFENSNWSSFLLWPLAAERRL